MVQIVFAVRCKVGREKPMCNAVFGKSDILQSIVGPKEFSAYFRDKIAGKTELEGFHLFPVLVNFLEKRIQYFTDPEQLSVCLLLFLFRCKKIPPI